MDLSVIVPTCNTRSLTLACVASVERALGDEVGVDAEVLVVDNGSWDGTAVAVRDRHPRARLIVLPENRGFAAACNEGLRAMRGRHALLLNSDARVLPGALASAVRFLDDHPRVGLLGPRLLRSDGSVQSSVHAFPSLATELVPAPLLSFCLPRRFPSRRSLGERSADVPALRGAAIFVRREVLEAAGLLDEGYFFFLEETDWCWRVKRAGYRVAHLPSARVVHLSGASSKRVHPGPTRIEYHRSLYRFFRERRGTGRMWMVRVVRFGKTLSYAIGRAPAALAGGAARNRWRADCEVLLWHLRGLPPHAGLRAATSPPAAPPAPGAER